MSAGVGALASLDRWDAGSLEKLMALRQKGGHAAPMTQRSLSIVEDLGVSMTCVDLQTHIVGVPAYIWHRAAQSQARI